MIKQAEHLYGQANHNPSSRSWGDTSRNEACLQRSQKEAWRDVAWEFHTNYRDKRFTPEHAIAAGYTRRKGELIPRDTKAFRQSYTGRKLRMFGHTNPLQFSGDTREL